MCMKNYHEKTLKREKSLFLKSGACNEGLLRPEVLASWKKCRAQRLDTKSLCPLLQTEVHVEKHLAYFRDYTLADIVAALYENLNLYKAALFYAYDKNGVIFSERGNQETLQRLNACNLKIGACIYENCLGTTGATFARTPNEDAWTIGEEHYLDIFTPFVTYCFYSEDFYGRTYTFIVLPKEHFSDAFLSFIRMFHKCRRIAIREYRESLELTMNMTIFNQLVENEKKHLLFLDAWGRILYFNQSFSTLFNIKLSSIKNKSFTELFPHMTDLADALEKNLKITQKEICFSSAFQKKHYMYMNFTPLQENHRPIGFILELRGARSADPRPQLAPAAAHYTFDDIIGKSGALRAVLQKAEKIAKTDSFVIITGESGTGKELLAQSIHNASLRRDKPFVAVNCAAIPPELITSELFGYVEGAFTGAKKGGAMGKFEYAHGGTLFLDEIAELPLYAQAMLLRALQERQIVRVGSHKPIPIDIKVISATNKDLKELIRADKFRSDLYYRLQVIPLQLPPLRERKEDIPLLLEHYLRHFTARYDLEPKRFSPESLALLLDYPWLGNLRELRNAVEYCVGSASETVLGLQHLPNDILKHFSAKQDPPSATNFPDEERARILNLLLQYNGNKSLVAKNLNISRATLYKKIKEYGLT